MSSSPYLVPYVVESPQVAEALLHDESVVLITGSGEILDTSLTRRSIGISSDELKRVPDLVAIAGVESKAVAVLAALRSGIVSTLITSTQIAERLLSSAA